MAFTSGKSAQFQLDNNAGALQDLSTYTTSVSVPFAVDSHDTSAFGGTAHTFVPGLKNATISVEGVLDVGGVISTHFTAALANASLSFQIGPVGTTAGYPKYTGECIITSFDIGTPVDDKVTWSASLQVTGAVTVGTF